MTFLKTIQSKIIIALTFLALLITGSTLFLNHIYENNLNIINNKSHLQSLSTSIETLERNNVNYIKNAPRDYESYNRDVKVFHATLLQDIQSIDQTVSLLSESKNTNTSLILSSELDELNVAIVNSQAAWNKFDNGLKEELGTKQGEPRLEWGAEFITSNAPALKSSFDSLKTQFDAISSQYDQTSKTISTALIAVLTVAFFIFAFWLFKSVIRPVLDASDTFKTVANGDYGVQIPTQRNDEIGVLIKSFNSLSSRTQLVISIISELQNSNHPTKAIESLHNLSSGYLDADFIGVLSVDSSYSNARYSFLSPRDDHKELAGKVVSIHPGSSKDTFLNQVKNREALLVNDIATFVSNHADAELIKTLSKYSISQSILLVPLQSDKWQGLLLVASNKLNHFNEKQLDLLSNLSPLIAKGIESSLVKAKTFSKLKAVNA